ncbi:MAG TPA: Crp/Fnr family transcriptional regulator [Paracoccaceae bacterium]|nr:Crp/Fnr family transcriptional regulator [Paracoccaceae bacterium]
MLTDAIAEADGFIASLGREEREALGARLRPIRFGDGEPIVTAGEPGADLYLILEGRAEVGLVSVQGREVTYRDVGPGDMIGEIAAIDRSPRSASVTARGPVLAGVLTRADFEALIADSPGFALAMMRHLTGQIRSVTERVFELSTMLVRDRVVREVLRRGRAAADGADRAELSPAPTHLDLASRIGANREAVSREMSRLSGEGLLTRAGRRLVIPSLAALAEELDDPPEG